MKRCLLLVAGLVALTACPSTGGQASAEQDLVPIEPILTNVKQALAEAQNALDADALPPLKSVTLELETVFSAGAGGTVNIYIVKLGGRYEKQEGQKLTLELVPPKATGVVPRGIDDTLVQLILSAARGARGVGSPPTPLELSKVEVRLRFVVQKSGEGGLGYTLAPVTVDFSGDLSQSAIQVLTVRFGK